MLEAKIGASSKDPKVLRDAIHEEPRSSRSIAWRASLVRLTDKFDEKQKIKEDGVNLADELLADRGKLMEAVKTDRVGEFTGFESFLVAMLRAELVEASGAPASEIDAAWKKTAAIVSGLNIPLKK